MLFATSAQTLSSSSSVLGAAMLLRATVTGSVQVGAASSLTTKEFSAKNGSKEEEKEESGEEKMKGYVCRSKGFIPMNFSNPKEEFFYVEGIEGGRSKVVGLKEKLAGGFSRGITLGFFNSSNGVWVLARSSR